MAMAELFSLRLRKWRTLVAALMNLWITQNGGKVLISFTTADM
jgi:hypothetical protein